MERGEENKIKPSHLLQTLKCADVFAPLASVLLFPLLPLVALLSCTVYCCMWFCFFIFIFFITEVLQTNFQEYPKSSTLGIQFMNNVQVLKV